MFGNIEIEKNTFYQYKTPICLKDEDIEKLLVSNKIPFGENNYKYFIGYLYNDNKIEPLHIMLPKTTTFVKSYFLIEDDDLLEKCNNIWDKVSADIQKEFDSEPACNKEFL